MGLFDKLKSVASDVASSSENLKPKNIIGSLTKSVVKSADSTGGEKVSELKNDSEVSIEQKPEAVATVSEKPVVINTLSDINNWFDSLSGLTPVSFSASQALQSQMQILKYIQSPTLTGMAIDGILAALIKALKNAKDDVERENVRDAYCGILQCFMFFSEAKFRYEIDQDKKESYQLLASAGEMLGQSVFNVATLAFPGAAIVRNVRIKNVFGSVSQQKSVFSKLASFFGKKAEIEEKKKIYLQTLNVLFDTFRQYASVIGPSVLINGILKRYIPQLAQAYKKEKLKTLKGDILQLKSREIESSFFSLDDNCIISSLSSTVLSTIHNIGSAVSKAAVFDFDYVEGLERRFKQEEEEKEESIRKEQDKIETATAQLSELSLLQIGKKKELKNIIEEAKARLESLNKELDVSRKHVKKSSQLASDARKIKEEVEEYENDLQDVADLFKLVL